LVAVPKLQATSSSEVPAGHDRSNIDLFAGFYCFARAVLTPALRLQPVLSHARADFGIPFRIA
jgi:hypothetical protein